MEELREKLQQITGKTLPNGLRCIGKYPDDGEVNLEPGEDYYLCGYRWIADGQYWHIFRLEIKDGIMDTESFCTGTEEEAIEDLLTLWEWEKKALENQEDPNA